jgi:glycosyltransferase involved in cell wall biosynthesis
MKISVIIPAYNAVATLPVAIQSVLDQVESPHEIILVDDGSTDDTSILLRNYPLIRYIFQSNNGPSSARNRGVSVSTGDYIAFLDSDDYWHPDHLLLLKRTVENNRGLKWAASAYIKFLHDNSQATIRIPSGYVYKGIIPDYFVASKKYHFVSTISLLIQKDIFVSAGGFPQKYSRGEDLSLWLRIALIEPKLGYTGFPTAFYTYNRNSLTNNKHDLKGLFQRVTDDYDFCSTLPPEMQKKSWWLIRRWVFGLIKKSVRSGDHEMLKEILKVFRKSLNFYTRLGIYVYLLLKAHNNES